MSFYLMHRGWMDNPAFSQEPFTDREAWLYLIEEASFEPHKIRYGSKMIEVGRGQVPTSYRRLVDKFKWGIHRTRNFLHLLEQEGMITRKTATGFLIITLCNYDSYQKPLRNSTTQAATPATTLPTTQAATNINNIKELKEGELTSDDVTRTREVFENVEKIINSPKPLSMSPVVAWMQWGADYELDIRHVAERWKEKNPNKAMNSLAWLDEDIARSITQRRKGMPEVSIPPPRIASNDDTHRLAETLEFLAELNGETKQ